MKRFTFLMSLLLTSLLQVNAQTPQFVSTEQQNRNVVLEEFTGRNCGYCPDGHRIANEIVAKNPGRVFPINIHCGDFSPTNTPNLNTTDGNTILSGIPVSGFPAGVVNRATAQAQMRNAWENTANQQLKQAAECNVAGAAFIDKDTRMATITVEVYYTGNSTSDKNYLTVMMLQDSILGSQSGGSDFNPSQMIGNKYCHMHVLRDVVTSTWGDEIAPTTQGTLITKTFEYEIPEVIGAPNGVEVDLDNIFFLAFVAEKYQGTPTRPILNAGEIHPLVVSANAYYPYFKSITVENAVSCSTLKPISLEVVNGGTNDITSLKFEAKVDDATTEFTWEGNIPSYSKFSIEEELEIPVGEHVISFNIVEVNGEAYSDNAKNVSLTSEEWVDFYFPGEEEEFKIDIVQDRYGNQTRWEIIASDNTVLASGGPYSALAANGIKMNRKKVVIPNNECIKFVIYDDGGDGINNGAGEGYYKITDSKGNVVVEGDGKFGYEAYHNISLKFGNVAVEEMTDIAYNIFPNPVKDILTIVGDNMRQVTIFNAMGQLVKTIECNDNTIIVDVNDMQNGMYFVNVVNNNGEVAISKVVVNN